MPSVDEGIGAVVGHAAYDGLDALGDQLRRSWRHLDYFQFEAWLHADIPREACASCGKTSQAGVPWAREGSGGPATT